MLVYGIYSWCYVWSSYYLGIKEQIRNTVCRRVFELWCFTVIIVTVIQYVAVIARCRVQYGKYFLSFSFSATYLITAKYEKRGKYLPKSQEATSITTLSLNACLLNACLDKMYQELSYLLIVSDLLNKI